MPRKLKTYQTSQGFYDLAVAVPSMKAALEAWGSEMNLFHKGFAKESDDPRVIAATLKKPGVVLKRAVGSTEPFSEHPHLPDDLPATAPPIPARKQAQKSKAKKLSSKKKGEPSAKIDEKAARRAALAYAKEERRLKKQRAREAAREAKKRAQREKATAAAEAALQKAQQEHDKITDKIEAEREALDKRAAAEDARWNKLKEKLDTALHKASR